MKQNTKEWIQYASAIAMLASAIVLVFLNFIFEHIIHSSVLMYVGEAIAFSGAVYGLAVYTHTEIQKQVGRLRKEIRDADKGMEEI